MWGIIHHKSGDTSSFMQKHWKFGTKNWLDIFKAQANNKSSRKTRLLKVGATEI
jgi:hypothetical protein